MPNLFLSYSRDDTLAMGILRDNLRRLGFNVWIDKEQLKPGTPQWEDAIEDAIKKCDCMLVICSPHAKQSQWVRSEIRTAEVHRKPVIPILVSGDETDAIPMRLSHLIYCDMRGRADAERGFRELVSTLIETFGVDVPDYELESSRLGEIPAVQVIQVTGHVEGNIIAVGRDVSGTINAAGRDIVHEALPMLTTVESTLTPPMMSASTPTTEIFLTESAPKVNAQPRLTELTNETSSEATTRRLIFTRRVILIGAAALFTLIVSGVSLWQLIQGMSDNTPTPTPTATEEGQSTEETDIPTLTQSPTNTRVPIGFPGRYVNANSEWTPILQTFDEVEMALAPVGCAILGSDPNDPERANIEQTLHSKCFLTPFWIDVYEVTNAQFAAFGGQAEASSGFGGDQKPRDSVSWDEASAFCELRGGRLPTDVEWEYAARGPDSLMYPWGNVFIADNAVYNGNANGQPANVGSRPNGISWVGALDMSGNISEWIKQTSNPTASEKELQGGSWCTSSQSLRTPYSSREFPLSGCADRGFRCARDWSPSD